jgi:chromosome segregation ATPase
MSTSGVEANNRAQELGKLGALLSDIEASWEKSEGDSQAPSVDELEDLLASIEESISDLEQRISSNRKEQENLEQESRKLKKDIRELTLKLAEEISQMTKATKHL